ncbi:MAG: methyltransferase [Planctomycetota bacterium]|nr:MAG: methyltransferase [Planctomycetota bacterium]
MVASVTERARGLFGELGLEALRRRWRRARYRAQQRGLAAFCGTFISLFHLAMEPGLGRRISGRTLELSQRRFAELLERDLEHAERGEYPFELLLQFPLRQYLRVAPAALGDAPRVLWRRYHGQHDELPQQARRGEYPRYYLRTFHWQTDGWFSERSARLYDVGVEVLFLGTADIMRRQLIPPLRAGLAGEARPRILDIACGTGRFLLQLHRTLPAAKLYGLDLSPYYLQHARRLLAEVPELSLLAENAEAMPLAGASFDAATSIFLFHELPAQARRNVAREALRVVRPGGRFVVCDSVQRNDAPELSEMMEAFPVLYHEPYYKGYTQDPLEGMLAECGFEVLETRPNFLSKIVVARRPD